MRSITIYGSDVDKMFNAIINAGADPINDDYILVIGTNDELFHVQSPVQIIRDKQVNGGAYLVKRKDYFQKVEAL